MARSLQLRVTEARDCTLPHAALYGGNPWLRVQINKQAVADARNVGVQVDTTTCTVKFTYNDTLTLPHSSETRIILKVMDRATVLGRATIKTKHLRRGFRDERWLDMDPQGSIRVILRALDFGKIEKPSTRPAELSSPLPERDFLRTHPASPPEPSSKRKKLRDYKESEIKRELPAIASGTYGIVYRGTVKDRKGEVVAIKDIKVTDNKLFEEWKNEIEFMAAHACPYIVEVFGFAASERLLTIVMEFADRGMLFDLLHKPAPGDPPMSLVTRVRMARHCAIAVSFLHSNNVLHRDIKSLNVLVTKNYVAKLSDFGAAKLIPPGTSPHQINHTQGRGTPLWMAPEVRHGRKYSLNADLFSLGVLLFEIFEVSLPLWDNKRQTIVLPSYNFESAPLVLPLLHLNPEDRPVSSTVAKQIDYILGYILTGGDYRVGVEVDLDELHTMDERVAKTRLKCALTTIKDCAMPPHLPGTTRSRAISHSANEQSLQATRKDEKSSDESSRRSVFTKPFKPFVHLAELARFDHLRNKDGKDGDEKEKGRDEDSRLKRERSREEKQSPRMKPHSHSDSATTGKINTDASPRGGPERPGESATQEPKEARFAHVAPYAAAPPKPTVVRRRSTPSELFLGSRSSKSTKSTKSSKTTPRGTPRDAIASEEAHARSVPSLKSPKIEKMTESDSPAPPRPTRPPRARAVMLYDFKPENPGELAMNAGDRLDVLQERGVWIEGVATDGRRGWVPTNYVHSFAHD